MNIIDTEQILASALVPGVYTLGGGGTCGEFVQAKSYPIVTAKGTFIDIAGGDRIRLAETVTVAVWG